MSQVRHLAVKLLAGLLAVLWPPYPFLRLGLMPGLAAFVLWLGAWLCAFLLWAGPGLLVLMSMSAAALAMQLHRMRR